MYKSAHNLSSHCASVGKSVFVLIHGVNLHSIENYVHSRGFIYSTDLWWGATAVGRYFVAINQISLSKSFPSVMAGDLYNFMIEQFV